MANNVFVNNTQVPNVVFTEVTDNLIVCNELKEEFFGISSLRLKDVNLLCEHFEGNEVKCSVKVGNKEYVDVPFTFVVDKFAEPKVAININSLPDAKPLIGEQPVAFAQKLLNEQKKVLRLEEDIKNYKSGKTSTDLITEHQIQEEVKKQISILEEEFLNPQDPNNRKRLAETIKDVMLENDLGLGNSALKNKILEDLKHYAENFSKNAVKRMQRYAEMMSGGGSVAQQFANGGTMKGDLTVTGRISASQIAGFAGGLQPINGVVTSTFPLSTLNTQVFITGTEPGYSLQIVNRANFDPGEPLTVDGRARITHVMNFQAGIPLFTNGSDHSHVFWSAQGRRGWQMIQNGGSEGDNSQFGDNAIFQLVTVVNNMGGTNFNEFNIHSVDTRDLITNTGTFPYLATNLKINFNTPTGNINGTVRALQQNEVVQLSFRLGFAGIVASTFPGKVTSNGPVEVTINGETKYQYTFELTGLDSVHWLPGDIRFETITTFGVPPTPALRVLAGRFVVSSNNVGLTGNYLNVPRYVLVEQTNHSGFVGDPVVLSTDETVLGLPAGDRNAFIKDVIDANRYVISVGNHYNWPTTSGTHGNLGWIIYKGSADAVHQYTPATQHFWYQRFRAPFGNPPDGANNTFKTGGNRAVALGNSAETDAYFSYAIGYNSSILKSTGGPVLTASSVFGGAYSFIQGSYSTAVGGRRLKITKDNQTAFGQYNNPDTDAIVVVGGGTSEENRTNALELSANGVMRFPASAFQTVGTDTYLRILGPNNEPYGIKLELLF